MKKNFVKSRWLFTMLLFVTTMIMPTMMLAKSITPTPPKGDGKTEPYQISTAAELYWFAGLVNGTLTGVKKNISANAKLMNNITVNEGVLDAINKDQVSGKDFIPWTPIGTSYSDAYSGTFDGQGHTISGLYFNDPKASHVGLFGCIYDKGKISKVGVSDSYFRFGELGGGVCGRNCYGILQNCSNSSTVIGNYSNTGGVCGLNWSGTVRDCKNTGSVRGKTTIGGVCGENDYAGLIENCFNEGTVSGQDYVGGVCGKSYGTIKSCYNTASVSGQDKSVGGVCGSFCDRVTNCYYLSGTATGGIEGQDKDGLAVNKSLEQFKSGEVAWLLNGKGFGKQVWGQHLGKDPYPVLGSDYKVIKAAQGDNDTYWATFSNLTNDATLSVPSGRTLNVYNATVSGGKMTLTQRNDNQVAKDEGVLLKTDGEYVNANKTNELTTASSYENHLVATPAEAQIVIAAAGCKLYRLTYNDADTKEGLGFYLSVDRENNSNDGTSFKATPGKAYLQVSENAAKDPSSAALARSFVFGSSNETTGIEEITIMGTDVQRHGTIEGIFDLQGRKISNPTKGIYIKNNKKVIIK